MERYAKENVIIILVGNKIDKILQKKSSTQSRNMKKENNPFSSSSHNDEEEEEEEEENHISSTKPSKRSTNQTSEIDQLVLEFIELYPSTVHFQVSAKTNTNISHLFSYLCEEMITKQLKERQLFLQNSSSSSNHKFHLIGETISLSSDSSSRRNRRKEDGGWGFNCCGSY